MTKHLPTWIMKRYSKLWCAFKEKEFTNEQLKKILRNDNSTAVFLSVLKKSKWLEMKMNEDDARKTIYKLKNPQKAIMEEIKGLNRK